MSNVVRIEVLRDLKATKEKQEQQGAKKVSVEEGFTAIPNELLFAMGRFGFTQRQFSVLMAVIQKTLSWHKEMDWISNSQLCELTGIKGEHKVSAVKNELFQMNVLIKKGRSFGLNLVVSEWEKSNLPEKGNLTQKGKSNLPEKGNRIYPNQVTTKETIPKEKINTPIIPQGENLPDGKYLAKSPRRVGEKINFDQIAECWNSENENRGGQLPFVEKINDKRKRAIKKFLGELKAPTAECAANYFRAFFEAMKPHHWGENERGWRANFDFAIRADIVLRVREEAL